MSDYESVCRWMEKISAEGSGSPNTRRCYLMWLRRFCDYVGMNPDQLIEARKQDLDKPIQFEAERRRFEDKLTSFFNHLQKLGLRRSSAVLAHAAVCSFFKANYLPLKLYSPRSWTEKVFKVPSKDELRAMCEVAKPQAKAWILCQAQSGISESDLLALPFSQIKSQLEEGRHPVYIKILRGKARGKGPFAGWYETFFGRNAVDALKEYLPNRKNPSDRIFDWKSTRHVHRVVVETAQKAGIEGRVTPHSLRRFFNTFMKLAGVNEAVIEYMMGHSLGRVRSAYFIPPKEELEKVYLKAEPYISI